MSEGYCSFGTDFHGPDTVCGSAGAGGYGEGVMWKCSSGRSWSEGVCRLRLAPSPSGKRRTNIQVLGGESSW